MLFRRLALAGTIGILAGAAFAQGLRPPRELPPPGFTGQQYTDSGGCVFLKAGLAGRTNWVPRVGADRRQLCGYPPTFSRQVEVAVAEEPAPRPAPVARQAPVAATPASAARPATAPAPAQPTVTATRGCPANAPYGQRARRADGTTALFCASSEARLAAALAALQAPARAAAPAPTPAPAPVAVTRAAAAPAAAPVVPPVVPGISTDVRIVCPAAAPNPRRVTLEDGTSTILCAGPDGDVQTAAAGLRNNGLTFAPVVPPGYRFAWEEDGRLNPRRGQGTVEGQMAQDRVWTRDVPARLVTAPAPRVAVVAQPQVTVSSSGGPQASGRLFVQVGSFGVATNATAAAQRLAALGLPVVSGKATIKGKPVQVVSAGPFASTAEAQAAVSAARRAGFSDAFIR